MIKGILLGISLAIFLSSLLLITTTSTGIIQENLSTGAVIGITQITSYATITLILSSLTTLSLIITLKRNT